MHIINQKKRLKKAAIFTDIHFGRKNNSETHNSDCVNFINWFTDNIKKDSSIDHINFLGDWFQSRSAINGLTLDMSYEAARKLNDLGMPIFFLVGNHDLYYKNNRKIYNTKFLENFKNIIIVSEPTIVKNIGHSEVLYMPFLFHHEYDKMNCTTDAEICFGHLEFNGFIVTGDIITMQGAVDHKKYKRFKRIITGHFHKRQHSGNVDYIGSAFPMDYSDANDSGRGMAIYDHDNDRMEYIDWEDSPTYIKTKLSNLRINYSTILRTNATVECLLDEDITHDDITKLSELLRNKFVLRSISFTEPNLLTDIQEGEIEGLDDMLGQSIDTIIKKIITNDIDVESIDNEILYSIYEELENV